MNAIQGEMSDEQWAELKRSAREYMADMMFLVDPETDPGQGVIWQHLVQFGARVLRPMHARHSALLKIIEESAASLDEINREMERTRRHGGK